MKGKFLLLALVLLMGCLGSDNGTTNDVVTPSPTQNDSGDFPKSGDVVSINYIMKTDDKVVDTTYEEVARSSPDASLIFSLHPFGFEPYTFIIDSVHINPEFSSNLVEMEIGEERTIILPPEKSIGGQRRDDRIEVMDRFSSVPREESIPLEIFRSSYDVEPEHGAMVDFPYWRSVVTEVSNDSVVLQHNPVEGSVFETPGGNITVSIEGTEIVLEFVPRIGETAITNDGRFITILSSNETHMVVDFNHPLAGKTLEVEFTLESVSEYIEWMEGVEIALSLSSASGKPVFLMFTDVSCVTCRRIELESLSNPLVLPLKDEFIWVMIDTELQEDVASQYGALELPVILIIKEGEEKSRITDFLPPPGLRAEMQRILES
jgi:FKBP-type peptidyl-prolyl cis-trans isomerase 2